MTTSEEQIFQILSEASGPLYSSDIAARLNQNCKLRNAYSPIDVVKRMQDLRDQVVQLSDGRWTLKRRMH